MPAFLGDPQPFSTPVLNHIREGCLGSPLVGDSPLAGTFRGTRGFAATFTRAGVDALHERLGFLRAFTRLVLGGEAYAALAGWRRLLGTPRANAFYLNLLVSDGAGVGPHVDATLRGPSGEATATPRVVSVLYLDRPAGVRGGELVLYDGSRPLLAHPALPGMLLHFRGQLRHEVRPLAAPGTRVSLVCEQYELPEAALGRLAPLTMHSRAGFAAYLEAAQGRPGAVVLDE